MEKTYVITWREKDSFTRHEQIHDSRQLIGYEGDDDIEKMLAMIASCNFFTQGLSPEKIVIKIEEFSRKLIYSKPST